MKLLAGTQARKTEGNSLVSAGLGVKYFPSPWLAFSAYIPYKHNSGVASSHAIRTSGPGDVFLAASFDPIEMLAPSMIPVKCPETGGPIVALADEDDIVKHPHLSLAAGLIIPVGKDDYRDHWWVIPAQYQPGTGVWTPSAAVFYSQGIGPVTPGVGASFTFSGGMNSAGYEAPDLLALSANLSWLFWHDRMGRFYTGLNIVYPQGKARQQDTELQGSDARVVLLDTGVSVWAASFWRKSRKIMAGALLTLPIEEGGPGTEASNGLAGSVFCSFGF